MATPLSADRLLKALRDEGLRVVEHRSWRTHSRNHKGPFGPVHGVMIHHTVTAGTASSVELCYNGYSALPGPLCHGVIAKDGTVYLVGNGRANHAGSGDDDVLRAVVGETALPADDEANTDGNRHFYGFECINLGDGKDPWPQVQLEAIEKAAAAICRAHGWGEQSVIGHLEWQPGKVDPRGPIGKTGGPPITMAGIRARVAARLEPAQQQPEKPAPTTPPKEASDVPTNWNRSAPEDQEQELVPGKWVAVKAGGVDLVTGATHYTGSVHLIVTAPEGGTVQGRWVHVRPDASRWVGPIVERLTTPGSSFMDFPHAGSVDRTERVRFEVVYFPADETDTRPAPIRSARLRGLYWK